MIVIGLTGGLASGKTSIARMFAGLGAKILDADLIAHRALYKNTISYQQVVKKFSKRILNADGSINRRKLAFLAFSSDKNQRQLCSIIHPWVFEYIRKKIKKFKKDKTAKVIIIEAVLLIESGFYKDMDQIMLVKSTAGQQIERAVLNRKMTKLQVKRRMNFQLSFAQKRKYADYIINNGGTLKDTGKSVKKIWESIARKYDF